MGLVRVAKLYRRDSGDLGISINRGNKRLSQPLYKWGGGGKS